MRSLEIIYMASVNKVILVGNLGADPETRYMPSGDAVTNIRLATTDRYKDKQSGEFKEATEWHRIAFFGKLAEIAGQYLKKGSSVYIEGRIRTRKWQDQSGQDKYSTEIVADQMQMLGGRGPGGGGDEGGYGGGAGAGGGGGYSRESQGGAGGGGYAGGRGQGGGQGGQGGQQGGQRRQQQAPSNGFEDMDDDIPF